MHRLIVAIGLIYITSALLLFLDNDARPEAVACGAPPPTATPGPPTATSIPPTASPEIDPTVDLRPLPVAQAPAGLHAIAACDTRDQVRAALHLFHDLLEEWEPVSIGKGPPPGMILVIFEYPMDNQRTIGLAIYESEGRAGREVAGAFQGSPEFGASIATDGKLVWMSYKRDGRNFLSWGAIGGNRQYTAGADNPLDLDTMIEALARAAEHACYPDCQ